MTQDQAEAVATLALHGGVTDATLGRLRGLYPGIHLTLCRDDDVHGAAPLLEYPGLNVYLVDGRNHCLTLTHDLDTATGLLLAEVSDEEE